MKMADRLRIGFQTDNQIMVQLIEQPTWLIAGEVIKVGETLPPIRVLADE
jgi:DNA-binding transcriptional regulator YhcF (GntR family)